MGVWASVGGDFLDSMSHCAALCAKRLSEGAVRVPWSSHFGAVVVAPRQRARTKRGDVVTTSTIGSGKKNSVEHPRGEAEQSVSGDGESVRNR